MARPKTGTREWAPSSVNIQVGCEHSCRYCYAYEMHCRFNEDATPETWAEPIVNHDKVHQNRGLRKRQPIMFPTMHDITRGNLDACLTVLIKLLEAGNRVLVVSKLGKTVQVCLDKQLREFKNQLMFRVTIGTYSPMTSRVWEPGAPPPDERIKAARSLCRRGYRVSISAEPLLGRHDRHPPAVTERLYSTVAEVSNGPIWFGPMNKIAARVHGVPKAEVDRLKALSSPESLREIYEALKDKPRVRFKYGFTKVIDMPPQTDDWPDLPEVPRV